MRTTSQPLHWMHASSAPSITLSMRSMEEYGGNLAENRVANEKGLTALSAVSPFAAKCRREDLNLHGHG